MTESRRIVRALMIVSFATLLMTAMQWTADATPLLNPCSSGDCKLIGIFAGNDKSSGPDKSLHVDALTGIDAELVLVGTDQSFDSSDIPGTLGGFTVTNDGDGRSGMWSYGAGTIDYVSVKAGPKWALYEYDAGVSAGLWSTTGLLVGSGNQAQLSHLTFWKAADDPQQTPEPGTIFLLGTGLTGLLGYGWWRRPPRTDK